MGLLHHSSHQQASANTLQTSGQHVRNAAKLSLKVTGPLLVVSTCTAVAIAANGTTASSSPVTGQKNTSANSGLQLHVDSQSAGQTNSSDQSTASPIRTNATVSTSDGTNTHVVINGQSVDVPANGTVQKTVTSPDGSTSVNVSTTTQGSSSNTSFSSTNLSVSNSSSSANSGSSTMSSTSNSWSGP